MIGNQSGSQECTTADSCFGLVSPRQYSIVPQRTESVANASQLLQSLCVLCSLVMAPDTEVSNSKCMSTSQHVTPAYNKKKITRWLGDVNFILWWPWKTI